MFHLTASYCTHTERAHTIYCSWLEWTFHLAKKQTKKDEKPVTAYLLIVSEGIT